MTKAQAKRWVLRCLAAEARHHLVNGSDWLYIDSQRSREFMGDDVERIKAAVEEVAYELERRGAR